MVDSPGRGSVDVSWTVGVVAFPGLPRNRGRWVVLDCQPQAVFTRVTGFERSPASTLLAQSKFGTSERCVQEWHGQLTNPEKLGGRAGLAVATWAPQHLTVELACAHSQGQS